MSIETLETVGCDLCGAAADQARTVLSVRDRIYGLPGEFTLVRCTHCGLLYLNPRPDRAHIGAYYPDLNYHAFRPASALKSRIIRFRREREARSLLSGLPANPSALEIGCGTGELLTALQDHGARAVGIEPNAAAAKAAADRHHLTVRVGMLNDIDETALPPCSFDLVSMKYALEHVHDPCAVLTRIAGLLRPGGRAVFWLPNAASWEMHLFGTHWRGLDAPRHLYIFTPTTIRRYAEAATGVHADDPALLLGRALSLIELGRAGEALDCVDAIPADAERCSSKGKPAVRFAGPDGKPVVAPLTKCGTRCRVKSANG